MNTDRNYSAAERRLNVARPFKILLAKCQTSSPPGAKDSGLNVQRRLKPPKSLVHQAL
jgi:hypothetical protein